MILAELEVYHSRPIAPTRRVAVGRTVLPVDDPPGFGGLLLGGVVARYSSALDPDLLQELVKLTYMVERGQKIPQPRLRHRLQNDRIGLTRSVHRLSRTHRSGLSFDFEARHHAPAQFVLAAVYAVGSIEYRYRPEVMAVVRSAIGWQGDTSVTDQLLSHLSGSNVRFALSGSSAVDPVEWAMEVLGFAANSERDPDAQAVQRHFRTQLRSAHPDQGGAQGDAARRIAEISEARRILLSLA